MGGVFWFFLCRRHPRRRRLLTFPRFILLVAVAWALAAPPSIYSHAAPAPRCTGTTLTVTCR